MNTRIIVAALVRNKSGKLLFCKMPENRGVFPGQWGIPGGGLEPGESMESGLRRELMEEIGVEVSNIERLIFKDGVFTKTKPDGSNIQLYMIFLVFSCVAESDDLILNEEFSEYIWTEKEDLSALDLNIETVDTLKKLGDPWL